MYIKYNYLYICLAKLNKMKKKLLVCTFSGGRTSAFMGRMLQEHPKYKEFDKVFLFANTGKERAETLDFTK